MGGSCESGESPVPLQKKISQNLSGLWILFRPPAKSLPCCGPCDAENRSPRLSNAGDALVSAVRSGRCAGLCWRRTCWSSQSWRNRALLETDGPPGPFSPGRREAGNGNIRVSDEGPGLGPDISGSDIFLKWRSSGHENSEETCRADKTRISLGSRLFNARRICSGGVAIRCKNWPPDRGRASPHPFSRCPSELPVPP